MDNFGHGVTNTNSSIGRGHWHWHGNSNGNGHCYGHKFGHWHVHRNGHGHEQRQGHRNWHVHGHCNGHEGTDTATETDMDKNFQGLWVLRVRAPSSGQPHPYVAPSRKWYCECCCNLRRCTADFPFWSYPTYCVASLRAGPVGCISYNM